MANVNLINGVNATAVAAGAPRSVDAAQQTRTAQTETDRAEARQQATPEQQAVRERDNVIAVSKDGDTVQASDEAVRELDEEETIGRVIGNPENARIQREQRTNGSESREELLELELERSAEIREAQIEAAQAEHEERRAEAAEVTPNAVLADERETIAAEGQISSFVGYSDAELERMYLQGSISKFDYDQEMESRAAEDEEQREELTDFALETTDNAARLERSELQGQEIERAFSDGANERLDAADRAQVIQAMQRTAQAEDVDPNRIASLTNFALS